MEISRVQFWWVLIWFLSPKGTTILWVDVLSWQATSEGVRKEVFPYKLHPDLVQVSEKAPIGFNGSAKNRKGQSYPLLSGGAQHNRVGPQGIRLISASQHTCPALEEPDLPWKVTRSWGEFSYWTCCSGRDRARDKRREKRRWARRRVSVFPG